MGMLQYWIATLHILHVKFEEITSKIDKRTGKEVEANPKFVKNGDAAMVKLVSLKPLCVETFKDYAPLGRFAVRDMRQTVAVGIIKEVTKKTDDSKKADKKTGKKINDKTYFL